MKIGYTFFMKNSILDNMKCAIFDMDGTILDTAEDLRLAMNHAMEATGHRHDFTREDAYFFFGS
ncbi:MAG: HAD hydrolase-like protein, partial [Treponema sp.]|nr:HAD hydrolase-like protein [Treponema sp.]